MFNPYPYDDPNAINHINFDSSLRRNICNNTEKSVKELIGVISNKLKTSDKCIIGIDGYISAPTAQFTDLLSEHCKQKGLELKTLSTDRLYLDADTLDKKLLEYLPEDREADPVLIYGSLYNEGYEGLMDFVKISNIEDELEEFSNSGNGVFIVYGNGALIDSLRSFYSLKLFIDVTQKRTILNIRNGVFGNLGTTKRTAINLMIRRSYYIDLEAASELRGKLIQKDELDYYLTGDHLDKIQLIPLNIVKELFSVMVTYPLRCRPVYLEGIWGGFYVKRLRNLPEEMKNCAWVFDLIPMEVSIVADIGNMELEFPFYCFVQTIGPKLMGEMVSKKFNNYFPIRFNYDDTFHSSGNMSIQVHPDEAYVKKNNKELGRQDESYYIVVAGQQAKTYIGFKDDADVEEFIEKARRAEKLGEKFNHDDYINSETSKPGMQFLIPAGTIHASGRNQVILEIGSLTIGSYTYKMYDYMRKDLEGNLRPIHTYHGDKVLRRDYKRAWVMKNLVQEPITIREGQGYEEVLVGQQNLLYFSLRNLIFNEKINDETTDRFHVLVLVEGEKVLIRSLKNPNRFFEQNYLDMVIVPANFGPYEIINLGVGVVTIHKTLLKDGYENE
jgi:mannose-6-phosphate isomerase class I